MRRDEVIKDAFPYDQVNCNFIIGLILFCPSAFSGPSPSRKWSYKSEGGNTGEVYSKCLWLSCKSC